MRLLICAGGTGGGVYPALSVLKQLMNLKPEAMQEIPGERRSGTSTGAPSVVGGEQWRYGS